ncbi:hypothetical protein B0H67DRAFT_566932 [Lasiosphaeris hirsuta]|uniref:Uncharacterized protein n=1 Tax=Lasiosphaeris hirsuta TaxID=260670 RepID=A0AA40BDH3_9PEZI|nr:hypothetical protein B0H67DRAFT_566932 [Lasiosphaeris hirsuta]
MEASPAPLLSGRAGLVGLSIPFVLSCLQLVGRAARQHSSMVSFLAWPWNLRPSRLLASSLSISPPRTPGLGATRPCSLQHRHRQNKTFGAGAARYGAGQCDVPLLQRMSIDLLLLSWRWWWWSATHRPLTAPFPPLLGKVAVIVTTLLSRPTPIPASRTIRPSPEPLPRPVSLTGRCQL